MTIRVVRVIGALVAVFILLTSSGWVSNKNGKPSNVSQKVKSLEGFQEATVLVTRVVDGDTIELEGRQKVRYIGINAPEIHDRRSAVQCFGQEAYLKNRELVEGKRVWLEKDVSETDRFGRLLRYVFINGVFVNDYLVRNGYAYAASFPPDVLYQAQFLEAQKEARSKNQGLWNSCSTHTY